MCTCSATPAQLYNLLLIKDGHAVLGVYYVQWLVVLNSVQTYQFQLEIKIRSI